MLDPDERKAILHLQGKGLSLRAIARALKVSRASVRKVVRSGQGEAPRLARLEFLDPYHEEIEALLGSCRGNRVRVHEILVERLAKESQRQGEEPPVLPYSTLTAYCRRHRIGVKPRKPSGTYHFDPGEEMQWDTSPHDVEIGGTQRRVQCASLVLCFSRRMFIRIFPTFNKFYARCFLSEAIPFLGGSAAFAMVDNTSVVVARGAGENAKFQPELEALGRLLGCRFRAHEPGDANRSARVERPFDYIERNFYAGRTFADLGDLNRQARDWCQRVNQKRIGTLGVTRAELFEKERPFLQPVPEYLPEVYEPFLRTVDVYGFVHLDRSRYSVPLDHLERRLQVRKYLEVVRIFDGPRLLAEHPRVPEWAREQSVLPEHRRPHQGRHRWQRVPTPEEDELREMGGPFQGLLDALARRHGGRAVRAIRELHRLVVEYPTEILREVLGEALGFGLIDIRRLEKMVLRRLRGDYFRLPNLDPEDPP